MPGFRRNRHKVNWLIDLALWGYVVSILFLEFCGLSCVILLPRGPLSIGALIPLKYFYFPVEIFITSIQLYGGVVLLNGVLLAGANILTYLLYVTVFFTRELRLGKRKYLSHNSIRNQLNIVLVYRAFQLLHQNAMCFMGLFLVACNATFMMAPIYINFALLRYWHELVFEIKIILVVGTFLLYIFWSILLELGRIFMERGKKVIGSWKRFNWGNKEDNKYMKKFVNSCQPILLSYGKQFVVGRVAVLNYSRGVVRGTMRTLLTTKRKL